MHTTTTESTMTITLSKEFDFCGCKDVYMNGKQIGDVIKDGDTYTIRVGKRIGSDTIYTQINTRSEALIITLVSNFINQH
jgi:hypothetical protein